MFKKCLAFRVRMTHGATLGPDYSYALIKTGWPNAQAAFAGTRQSETIRTADREVRVQLSPFRMAFYDRAGRLISRDANAWPGTARGVHR